MALTTDTRFEQLLRERIGAEREGRQQNLGGGCAKSYDAYMDLVGYLRALREVEEWCGEVAAKMSER